VFQENAGNGADCSGDCIDDSVDIKVAADACFGASFSTSITAALPPFDGSSAIFSCCGCLLADDSVGDDGIDLLENLFVPVVADSIPVISRL